MTFIVEPSADDPLMPVEAVANIFGVKAYTVRQWIKEGKIRATKLGGVQWRIPRSEMIRFANEKYGEDKDD